MRGTGRMYDRHLAQPPAQAKLGLRHRIETLVGITGARMVHHRASWGEVLFAPLNVLWRPQILGILIFEVRGSTCFASLLFGSRERR